MKQKFFNITTNKGETTASIYIYGIIGSYWDGNDAKAFQKEFSQLEKDYKRINIYINSPGGSVNEGLPIFNAIKNSSVEVHTYVIGVALSFGFMIALAAPKGNAHAYKGSLLMAHTVSTYEHGNAKRMRKTADDLEKYDKVLASLIADRSGRTVDEVKKLWMDHEDHYFTPDEALEEGFIDVIEDKDAEDMPEDAQNLSYHQVAAYYDERMEEPSESLMSKIMNRLKSYTGIDNSNNKNDNMFGNKFPKLTALAKVAAASVTADLVEAANTDIANAEIEGVTLVLDSELEATSKKVTDLEADVTAKDTSILALQKKVTDKDTEIENLKKEVNTLKGKPAGDSVQPKAVKDVVPEGEKEKEVENFLTSVDKEYEAIYGE